MHRIAAAFTAAVLLAAVVAAGCLACVPPEPQQQMAKSHPCCDPDGPCKPSNTSENQLRCSVPDLGPVVKTVNPKVSFDVVAVVEPVIASVQPDRNPSRLVARVIRPSPHDPLSQSSVLRI